MRLMTRKGRGRKRRRLVVQLVECILINVYIDRSVTCWLHGIVIIKDLITISVEH